MRELLRSRFARAWALLLFLVAAVLWGPAFASSLYGSLTQLLVSQSGGSPDDAIPPGDQVPQIQVGGPLVAGDGFQLNDSTARYQKTDFVIHDSTGPFAFTRTYWTSPGFYVQPYGNFSAQPQWRNNITSYVISLSPVLSNWKCNGPSNCVAESSFRVLDPESGTFLDYFSRNGLANPYVAGFQPQASGTNPGRLYLDGFAADGGPQGFILFKPTAHYFYYSNFSGNVYYLTRIESTRYAQDAGIVLAQVNYSSPGVVSGVTTADGTQLVFTNAGGLLQSIAISNSGTNTTIASYAYNAAGLITSVTYPETGTGESYNYGTSGNEFEVNSGVILVNYTGVDAGGIVLAESNEDHLYTFPFLGGFTDSNVTKGDGTNGLTDLQLTYTIAPAAGLNNPQHLPVNASPQTSALAVSCYFGTSCLGSHGAAWQFNGGDNANDVPFSATNAQPASQSRMLTRLGRTPYLRVQGRFHQLSYRPSTLAFFHRLNTRRYMLELLTPRALMLEPATSRVTFMAAWGNPNGAMSSS